MESKKDATAIESAHDSCQGSRPTMEDEHCIIERKTIQGQLYSFYAVYDGHGGTKAAEYCRDKLFDILCKEMTGSKPVKEALFRAFLKTDIEFLKTCGKDTAGCTAVVVLIQHSNPPKLWCANAGDSRAVLCRQGKAIPLSLDHKPDRSDERKRIEARGGFVMHKRVSNLLAVSRAIGDLDFKQDVSFDQQLVIAEPEIQDATIGSEDEFVLLACDGLYDVMTDQEAIDYIRKRFQSGDTPRQACVSLTTHAINVLKSKDNVTIVIVKFS